ncbi:outer membrane lipoprotein-sorting protein [Mucilaginibacter conchicola]|nr:outer membrane lipoprotein-sorting protein [Mucilaginibacter conchicola]
MFKTLSALLFITCLSCFSAVAQKLPSAEKVIARYVEVIGGSKKWAAIKTSEFRLELSGDSTVKIHIVKKIPDAYYQSLTAANASETSTYNKGKLVNTINSEISRITDPKAIDDLALQAYALPDMAYKNLGYTMVNLGIKYVDDMPCYEIKLVSKLGTEILNYYEVKSGYLRMVDTRDMKSYFEDYKMVQGYGLPHDMKMLVQGTMIVFKVKSWVINKPIDESLFITPDASK